MFIILLAFEEAVAEIKSSICSANKVAGWLKITTLVLISTGYLTSPFIDSCCPSVSLFYTHL